MIHITSEGNLFTSFCISVAGTASFHQLTVTALIQFSIQSFLFLLVNCNLFAILKKKKKKKTVLQDCFWCCLVCPISAAGSFQCCLVSALFVPGIHFQWIENFKANSSGSVGKLTERKWTTHMESNTVRRVTLELT